MKRNLGVEMEHIPGMYTEGGGALSPPPPPPKSVKKIFLLLMDSSGVLSFSCCWYYKTKCIPYNITIPFVLCMCNYKFYSIFF